MMRLVVSLVAMVTLMFNTTSFANEVWTIEIYYNDNYQVVTMSNNLDNFEKAKILSQEIKNIFRNAGVNEVQLKYRDTSDLPFEDFGLQTYIKPLMMIEHSEGVDGFLYVTNN